MDKEKKTTKNRPFFKNGYKTKLKKKMHHYIKHDTKITKAIFTFGRFIIEF